jgi:hypothetical protein
MQISKDQFGRHFATGGFHQHCYTILTKDEYQR